MTDDPERFPALDAANLSRFLPTVTPAPPANPLLETDWLKVIQAVPLRDLIADIRPEPDETFSEGPYAGQTFKKIVVQLDPAAALRLAFGDLENAEALVAAFTNEEVEMSLAVWLDPVTSRRVRQQVVVVVQGSPAPTAFGYTAGDVAEGTLLRVIFTLQSDVIYTDVNAPVQIDAPL
jgi:hypothetical protein